MESDCEGSDTEEAEYSSDDEASDSSDDVEIGSPPPAKRARQTTTAVPRARNLRMTKAEAGVLRQASTEFPCGIQSCEVILDSWKTAKAHLDATHYADPRAPHPDEGAASTSKGKAATKPRAKGKENRSASLSTHPPRCLYPGCSDRFTTLANLYRHIKTVHWKINRAACPYCPTTCSRIPLLRQHVLSRHRGQSDCPQHTAYL